MHDLVAATGLLSEGEFPGSFKLPGTNTSLGFHGYAKLDIIRDLNAFQGGSLSFPAIPLDGTAAARRQGATRLHTRQSRFKIVRTVEACALASSVDPNWLEGLDRLAVAPFRDGARQIAATSAQGQFSTLWI